MWRRRSASPAPMWSNACTSWDPGAISRHCAARAAGFGSRVPRGRSRSGKSSARPRKASISSNVSGRRATPARCVQRCRLRPALQRATAAFLGALDAHHARGNFEPMAKTCCNGSNSAPRAIRARDFACPLALSYHRSSARSATLSRSISARNAPCAFSQATRSLHKRDDAALAVQPETTGKQVLPRLEQVDDFHRVDASAPAWRGGSRRRAPRCPERKPACISSLQVLITSASAQAELARHFRHGQRLVVATGHEMRMAPLVAAFSRMGRLFR